MKSLNTPQEVDVYTISNPSVFVSVTSSFICKTAIISYMGFIPRPSIKERVSKTVFIKSWFTISVIVAYITFYSNVSCKYVDSSFFVWIKPHWKLECFWCSSTFIIYNIRLLKSLWIFNANLRVSLIRVRKSNIFIWKWKLCYLIILTMFIIMFMINWMFTLF